MNLRLSFHNLLHCKMAFKFDVGKKSVFSPFTFYDVLFNLVDFLYVDNNQIK